MHSYPRIMHAESIIFGGSKKLDNVLDQKRVKSVVGNIRVAYSQQLSAESEETSSMRILWHNMERNWEYGTLQT